MTWRDTLRSLRASPVYASMTVLALGLALALVTTTFAIIDSVTHPVAAMPEQHRVFGLSIRGGSPARWPGARELDPVVESALGRLGDVATTRRGYRPVAVGPTFEDLHVVATSRQFFATTRQTPVVGRLFADDAADEGAVISFRLWQRLFAGRPLGDSLSLSFRGRTYSVTGVMPRRAHFPFDTDLWISYETVRSDTVSSPRMTYQTAFVRLRPSLTQAEGDRQLQATSSELTARFSTPERPLTVRLEPLQEWTHELTRLHKTFGVVAVIVLIIACANVGAMMLARGMARAREIALRLALGATRRRVVASVMLECGLLTMLGAAVGVLLTSWSLHVLVATMTRNVPSLGDVAPVPSARVFLFVFAAATLVLLLAGALPAFAAATTDPASPLKDGSGSTSRSLGWHHSGLIVSQVALSTGLLMGAVLLMRSTAHQEGFQFGYPAHALTTSDLQLNNPLYPDSVVQRTFDAMIARLESFPEVRGVAAMWSMGNTVALSEQGRSGERYLPLGSFRIVSPGFLNAMGIPIVAGRDLEIGDRRRGAVVVDELAARKLWPDVPSPVGHMIKLRASNDSAPWLRVVGVSRTTELFPRRDVDLLQEPQVYALVPDDNARRRSVVVRGDGDISTLVLNVRRTIQQMAPGSTVRTGLWIETFESRLQYATFLTRLFLGFGLFAALLTGVGIYGTLAYAVTRRSREFGIRFALGASARAVSGAVVRQAAVLLLAGIGVGAFIALGLTRFISDMLYTVPHAEVVALVAAELALVVVGVAAALGPVRRALESDPADVLRAI